ncbi:titin homolog isoform X1 [Mytilus californianus]|uniref:titin homolog isoform X1 n=2 Tax=Mytilus californianus TaxID=6549 RepID=UPI00224531E2|nr:titin homolog isoform X1 [Mytilus californianus]
MDNNVHYSTANGDTESSFYVDTGFAYFEKKVNGNMSDSSHQEFEVDTSPIPNGDIEHLELDEQTESVKRVPVDTSDPMVSYETRLISEPETLERVMTQDIVEKRIIKQAPVERIMTRPVEYVRERPVEYVRERPVEYIRERPIQYVTKRPVEVVRERVEVAPQIQRVIRPAPTVRRMVQKPVERVVQTQPVRVIRKPAPVERVVQRVVEPAPVERYVQRVVEPAPVERIVQRVVEPAPVQRVITRSRPAERIVTAPVERVVTRARSVGRVVRSEERRYTTARPVESVITTARPVETVMTRTRPTESIVTTARPVETFVTRPASSTIVRMSRERPGSARTVRSSIYSTRSSYGDVVF